MEESNLKVIAIAGPNGAGKSTIAPFLLRDRFGLMEYVNADTIAQGLSAFSPEQAGFAAGRVMLQRMRSLARQRRSFAFESTLASRSYAQWIYALHKHGYDFHLLFIWLSSPDLAVARVRERVRLGGHDVPEEVIRRRYRKGIRNFFELYQGLADTWVIYDNSVFGKPSLIAKGSQGITHAVFHEGRWAEFRKEAI
jgi:predicted ABC-type ATPase